MLYCGEHIGNGDTEPKVDIAVDPLDGTSLISQVTWTGNMPRIVFYSLQDPHHVLKRK